MSQTQEPSTPENSEVQDTQEAQNRERSEQLRLEAQAAYEAKDFESVVQLLAQATEADPNNYLVHLDLVKMYLNTGHLDQAINLFYKLPEEAQNSKEGQPFILLLLGAKIINQSPSLEEIQATLQENPNDADMLYGLTGFLIVNHAYEQAMQTLLKLFTADKDYKEGFARETLLKMFEVLQPVTPELVTHYRRKLQSLLF